MSTDPWILNQSLAQIMFAPHRMAETVPGLNLAPQARLEELTVGKDSQLVAGVTGEFKSPHASLLFGNKPLNSANRGGDPQPAHFSFKVQLRGPSTPFSLSSVDAIGLVRHQYFVIEYSGWQSWRTD